MKKLSILIGILLTSNTWAVDLESAAEKAFEKQGLVNVENIELSLIDHPINALALYLAAPVVLYLKKGTLPRSRNTFRREVHFDRNFIHYNCYMDLSFLDSMGTWNVEASVDDCTADGLQSNFNFENSFELIPKEPIPKEAVTEQKEKGPLIAEEPSISETLKDVGKAL